MTGRANGARHGQRRSSLALQLGRVDSGGAAGRLIARHPRRRQRHDGEAVAVADLNHVVVRVVEKHLETCTPNPESRDEGKSMERDDFTAGGFLNAWALIRVHR